jgi:hypothetical protein
MAVQLPSKARGVSEAEIIRRALENELRRAGYRLAYNDETWKKAYQFMLDLDKRAPVEPKKRDWTREDLYEDRMKRYDRNSD